MTTGGRNLMIMGVLAAVIAIATAGVSLAIYHNTGDIYLDRSRPGFLPDEEEIEQDVGEEDFTFDTKGKITKEAIDEYLEKLQEEIKMIDAYDNPFGEDALSDQGLGIE